MAETMTQTEAQELAQFIAKYSRDLMNVRVERAAPRSKIWIVCADRIPGSKLPYPTPDEAREHQNASGSWEWLSRADFTTTPHYDPFGPERARAQGAALSLDLYRRRYDEMLEDITKRLDSLLDEVQRARAEVAELGWESNQANHFRYTPEKQAARILSAILWSTPNMHLEQLSARAHDFQCAIRENEAAAAALAAVESTAANLAADPLHESFRHPVTE